MLERLFESLYHKIFIAIIVDGTTTAIDLEICSKERVLDSAHADFETENFTKEMHDFIESYIRESPYYYIAFLDISREQGAMPTCDKSRALLYGDITASEYKCFDDQWMSYTSKADLYAIEKRYKDIGLDFYFSPFTLILDFFADKIKTNTAMYLLVQRSALSVVVFEDAKLLFAEHLDMEGSLNNDDMLMDSSDIDDESLDLDEGIDLDDIDVDDDMDMLDDFGDIEDLDALEDIDEFSENQDIEEEFYEAQESIEDSLDDGLNEDYQRFTLIQGAIGRFYKEPKYRSIFVESIYIANGVGASNELKRYLEEEMFLSVYMRHIDIGVELCKLAKQELKQ